MATSSIPTAKVNLVAQLQARGGLSGVQVTNGMPLPDKKRELIWVGTARGQQELGTFGTTTGLRREQYGLEVAVVVNRQGTDIVAADARCFALMAELENQLRGDPTINNAVMLAYVGGFELGEFIASDGMARGSELLVTVEVDTWI